MHKVKLTITIIFFSLLLSFTSLIKNKTRVIEKNTQKIVKKIDLIEKDLNETQLDFFYLSSPKNISQKIENLDLVDYLPMDFSRMYLNYEDFKNSKKKITILKSTDEKKIQKK